MKFICLVYHEDKKLDALIQDDLDAIVRCSAECGVWVNELIKGGHHVSSAGLQSVRTARTLRKRNGTVSATDGPFTETKEVLGGFTIINARDMNEAIQLASKLPAMRFGSVEVRPILEPDAELTDPIDQKIAAAMRMSQHPE